MLPMERARAIAAAADAERVALDPVIGPKAQKWEREGLESFEQRSQARQAGGYRVDGPA